MTQYKTAMVQTAVERLMRQDSTEPLLTLIDRVEQLVASVQPDQSYREDEIARRIGFASNKSAGDGNVSGKDLLHDLRLLIEAASDKLDMSAEALAEPVLTVADVAERFGVSTKTVDRWRRRGLAGRRLRFGNRRRVGFLQSSVDRFAVNHVAEVRRGTRFSQLTADERQQIVERARLLANTGESPSKIARQLAKALHRSPETIRYTLKDHDNKHPENAVFPNRSTRLSEQQKADIYRLLQRGVALEQLASRYGRSTATVKRIANQMRAQQLIERPIDYIDNEEFDSAGAEKRILGPAPETPRKARTMRAPAGIPAYLASLYEVPLLSKEQEAHYFRKMNYLKYRAARLRDRLNKKRPKSQDLDRIESFLSEAHRVRNLLIRRNLRLVVSVAKKFVKPGMNFFELVSDGNVSLMRAIDRFDYGRGFKLSTYATWAIRKNFARTIPAEHVQKDRYRTGHDEMFRESTDEGTSLFEQEQANRRQREILNGILGQLNDRERDILVTRFGLIQGEEPQTLEQVGSRLGVTKERVRQLEKRALGKMRHIADDEKVDIPGL